MRVYKSVAKTVLTWVVVTEWTGGSDPNPGKSRVAIGFLRHSCTDPLGKQLYPGVQLFLERGMYGPLCNTLMTVD